MKIMETPQKHHHTNTGGVAVVKTYRMKSNLLSIAAFLILFFCFAVATPETSQAGGAVVAKADTQTIVINGHWLKQGTNWDFVFTTELKVDGQGHLSGGINWTVVKADASGYEYYKSKMNTTATEYVTGAYDPVTNTIKMHGTSKYDPNDIIGLDTYELKLLPTNKVTGKTEAQSSWLGVITGSYFRK
jgi:hypothetical protein